MPGRKTQPVSVIEAKGVTHLTNAEKEARRAIEMRAKGAQDRIKPPAFTKGYWTKKERQHFKALADELMELDIFFNLDVDTLALYIDARMQYVQIAEALKDMKPVKPKIDQKTGDVTDLISEKNYASLQRTKELVIRQLMTLASDLGLTLSSRMKLVVPEKEDKPANKFLDRNTPSRKEAGQ